MMADARMLYVPVVGSGSARVLQLLDRYNRRGTVDLTRCSGCGEQRIHLTDTWSRETIRSLRRRLKNVKAELVRQSRFARTRMQAMQDRRAELRAEQRRRQATEAALAHTARQLMILREQMEHVAKMEDNPASQKHDMAWAIRWHLGHPYEQATAPANL